jgi:MFS family permease
MLGTFIRTRLSKQRSTPTRPLRIRVRPVLHGQLGRLLGAFALFEIGNLAATLLILRATDLLTPAHGLQTATQIALGLYTAYNIAATVVSFPAGKVSDRLRQRGPLLVLAAGVATFLVSYVLFALTGPAIAPLAFIAAGIGIGCTEPAEHAAVAALAPEHLRGSAFGLLATVQAGGDVIASTLAGLLYHRLTRSRLRLRRRLHCTRPRRTGLGGQPHPSASAQSDC